MTRDLLDDLRDADPVDRDALEVPATIAARVLGADATPRPRPRARHRMLPAAGALATAAAAVVLVLALVGGGAGPDLAARAYAAAAGPARGVVHWRVDLAGYTPDGKIGSRQRTEGFKRGATMHVLHSDLVHGKPHVTADTRTVGHRSRYWLSVSDDYGSMTLPKARSMRSEDVVFRDGDPLVASCAISAAGAST
jgi:hypothetical protein